MASNELEIECWVISLVFWALFVATFPNQVSGFHAITIVILSVCSISGVITEIGRHAYTTTYFVITLFQMLHRRDWMKVAHHLISIVGLYIGMYDRDGFWIDHKLGSYVMFIEASTPLLHLYKSSGSKLVGILFALSFILLRSFWLGYLMYTIWGQGPVSWFLTMQWSLNQIWTVEIIKKFGGKSVNKDKQT
jgi:hypothetical protein